MEEEKSPRQWIEEWDNVAYDMVLPALENEDYERAEKGATYLVEIDAKLMRAIEKAELAMGEK